MSSTPPPEVKKNKTKQQQQQKKTVPFVNGVFKSSKLAVHFKLTLDMIFGVL